MARKISIFSVFFILHSAAWGEEFFNTTPQPIKSNFTCVGRMTGYYADLPSNCRVYHNCDDQGNKFSYYCPEMTAFRQEALICDHAHLVDCQAGTRIGKKSLGLRENLDQSTPPSTTRTADRWTTANPFRDFFLNTNLTVRDRQRTRTTNSTLKTSGTNPFGLYFGASSSFRNNQGFQNSGNDRQSLTFFGQNGTRFFGNNFEGFVRSKEILFKAKTSGDETTANSRGQPAWNNRGDDARGRPKAQPDYRHVGLTGSHLIFGQTTRSYFDFKNSNQGGPGKAEVKFGQIPLPTTLKTSATTPSTSEIPLRDFTASLKPLVPNTLEYDPYYPRESWTTTESYYTPAKGEQLPLRALDAPNFEPPIFGVYFKIPDVWPDFNTLDDIVDRRKLFYIPRTRKFR